MDKIANYIKVYQGFFIFYFIWLFMQICFLLLSNCTWERGMYYPKLFFPFSGYPEYFYSQEKNVWTLLVYTYSYSEFFIYSLVPLGIKYLVHNHAKEVESTNGDNRIVSTQISNDPEIKILQEKIQDLEEKSIKTELLLHTISKSFEQQLIDKPKYDEQDKKLTEEYESLKIQIENTNNRIKAIHVLKDKFISLDKLVDSQTITIQERALKREELIDDVLLQFRRDSFNQTNKI